eukprot:383380-Rhodomonas_salina.4
MANTRRSSSLPLVLSPSGTAFGSGSWMRADARRRQQKLQGIFSPLSLCKKTIMSRSPGSQALAVMVVAHESGSHEDRVERRLLRITIRCRTCIRDSNVDD